MVCTKHIINYYKNNEALNTLNTLNTSYIISDFYPQIMFYYMFSYCILSFIKYINNKDIEYIKSYNSQYTYQYKKEKEISKFKSFESIDILEDDEVIYKKQSIIEKMLSLKSIERCLVLYYIFKIKGDYQIKTHLDTKLDNKLDTKQYNSYREFKNMETFTNTNTNTNSNTNTNTISLDETLEPDMNITIGDKEYNINSSHLQFISWLYYSGLYNYINSNSNIKYNVLKEMNDKKLLRGSVFLCYQLYLLDTNENEYLEDTRDSTHSTHSTHSIPIDETDTEIETEIETETETETEYNDNDNDNDNDNEEEFKKMRNYEQDFFTKSYESFTEVMKQIKKQIFSDS